MNTMLDDWLEKHGDPAIEKKVEDELKRLEEYYRDNPHKNDEDERDTIQYIEF